MRRTPRGLARNLLVAVSVAALAGPAWATITDDINPFGNIVQVTLSNPTGQSVRGTVYVTADVENSWGPIPSSEEYEIAAYDEVKVDVVFDDKVEDVVSVTPIDE